MSAKKETTDLKSDVTRLAKDIQAIAKKAKGAFDELDPQTKKKIVSGIAALGGLIAVRGASKKVSKHSKTKNKK